MELQIFHGPFHQTTGKPRMLAVVWDGNTVFDTGDIERIEREYPALLKRTLDVRISLRLIEHFVVEVGTLGEQYVRSSKNRPTD